MKNSFKLATILGIPIEVNVSWFIILGLVVLTLAKGYFPLQMPNLSVQAYWIMGFVAALLLFASLGLHELAHSVVARANKLPISGITLFIFGGVAHMEKEPSSPIVEFRMAIAGPIMSLMLALFFWISSLFAVYFSLNPVIWITTDYLSFLNFAIAVFNLIPGFPLDGGRVLRSIIWFFSKDLKKATQIASFFGKTFSLFLMGIGFANLITGNLISGIWLIFMGLFLLEAAEVSYRQMIMKKVLGNLKASDIMSKNVITVPYDIKVSELIEKFFFRFRHNCFPVIKDDTIVGLVTFHDTKEVNKNLWSEKTAEEVAIPLTEDLVTKTKKHVIDLLPQLAHNKIGRALVIEEKSLVGIVSQKDIMKIFKFRTEVESK